MTWTRRAAPYAPLLLRVVTGVVMAAHGYDKLTGEGGPAGFGEGLLAGLGLPAPVVLAWVVTVIELGGGIALILGVVTRLAAVLNAAVLVGAIAFVKLDAGLIAAEGVGYELDLVSIAGLLAVAMLGPSRPSRPSLDHVLGVERAEPDAVGTR